MKGHSIPKFLPNLTLLLKSLLNTYPRPTFSNVAPSDSANVIARIWSAITLNPFCPT